MTIDPRLAAALSRQFATRRVLLQRGADHVGWKLGMGERESIGGPVIGYLTSATVLDDGATYETTTSLHADAELAVKVGEDGSARAYATALELVDLRSPPDSPDDIVAENVFHRAVAFGPWSPALSDGLEARLIVNGDVRAIGAVAEDAMSRVQIASHLLRAMRERLRDGDRIITGSIAQVQVASGDHVVAEIDTLGSAEVMVTA